jgi:hypothetical protein
MRPRPIPNSKTGNHPLLRGGVDAPINKNVPFLFIGEAGEVIHCRNLTQCLTSPSAPLRNGTIFLMAQPPLLEGGVLAALKFLRIPH